VLLWMQVGTLIAISVAIRTRFSLVVNVPATILIYVGGNLTRFVDDAASGKEWLTQAGAQPIDTIPPSLATFDLTRYTVFSPVRLEGTESAQDPLAVLLSNLWIYVGVAGLYFVAYVTFTLTLGHLSLRRRELGGNEG